MQADICDISYCDTGLIIIITIFSVSVSPCDILPLSEEIILGGDRVYMYI